MCNVVASYLLEEPQEPIGLGLLVITGLSLDLGPGQQGNQGQYWYSSHSWKKNIVSLSQLTRHIGHERTLLGTFEKSIQHKNSFCWFRLSPNKN